MIDDVTKILKIKSLIFTRESKIVIIWLSEKEEKIPEDLRSEILCINIKDIELLKKVEHSLKEHFNRSWVYTGSESPYGVKLDYMRKLETYKNENKPTNDEYNRILDLTLERKLPVELELVLFEGDKNELHIHKICPPKETDYQVEFYLVPTDKIVQFEFEFNKKNMSLNYQVLR